MKFGFTDEQTAFREQIRRFFEDKSPISEVRHLMESGDCKDLPIWQKLSQELELTAIHIPEEYGGHGGGISELSIACEEAGRALLCAPYFATTVMAATAIIRAGTRDQKSELLPLLATGRKVATLALAEDTGHWDASGVSMTATQSGTRYTLNGVKSFVLDGHSADLVVVAAREQGTVGVDGLSFFTLAGDAPGLQRTQLESTDATRKIARLTFDNVEADLLGEAGAAAAPLQATLDISAVCLANEMVGGAEKLLEDAIAYAKMRVQFGRPIASFQSLKHKAADMLLDVELAKSAAYYAAAAIDDNDDDASATASLAKAAAADAYMQTAIHAIQIHGGIGFTWDNDTHLWFKRAKSSEVFLGTPAYHRERLMQQWNV